MPAEYWNNFRYQLSLSSWCDVREIICIMFVVDPVSHIQLYTSENWWYVTVFLVELSVMLDNKPWCCFELFPLFSLRGTGSGSYHEVCCQPRRKTVIASRQRCNVRSRHCTLKVTQSLLCLWHKKHYPTHSVESMPPPLALGNAVTLTFDLLTPKLVVFILVSKCTSVESLVKICLVLFKIFC